MFYLKKTVTKMQFSQLLVQNVFSDELTKINKYQQLLMKNNEFI